MDSDTLVRGLFNSGARLIEALDRVGCRVSVAAWVKTPNEQKWTLYIASRELEEKGLVLGYRTLSDSLRLVENNLISVSDVKLIGNDTQTTKELLEAQARYPVTEPQRSQLTLLGGVPIEFAFVYPSSKPESIRADQTILKFVLLTNEHPMQVFARFHPNGGIPLNRTEWRGKEPRSCGVGHISSSSRSSNSSGKTAFTIEVEYKPKGSISYAGETRYNGWTALLLDQTSDGILLDGQGNPLPEGHPPIYIQKELYKDIEFNELDFGDFVGEFGVEGIKQFSYEAVANAIQSSSNTSMSSESSFMAQRRKRPTVKIILSANQTSVSYDGFGTELHNINSSTPYIQQVIIKKVLELIKSFLEGRSSLMTFSNKDLVFVHLDDLLVDYRTSMHGNEPRFKCLNEFVSDDDLFDIAMKLIQLYDINAHVVTGTSFGLLLDHNRKVKK